MKTLKLKACAILLVLLGVLGSLLSCTKETSEKPIEIGATALVIKDTAYGQDPKQKMDIFLPKDRNEATKVVFLIHGGGWAAGDKTEMDGLKNLFLKKWPEAALVNINYRLAGGTVHHEEIMNDISQAIAFVHTNKSSFGISDNSYMLGTSAGAHLALLYAYKFDTANKVKAVADFYGPVKLDDWEWYNSVFWWNGTPVKQLLTAYNGKEWDVPLYEANSPFSAVNENSKPTIVFHGTLDAVVPIYQSQWFTNKLNTLGVPSEYHEYLDGHGFNDTNNADAVTKAVAFFGKY